MFDLGAPELIIILIIVVLLFGPGRLSKTFSEIGKGIRAFKESMSDPEETSKSASETNSNPKQPS